MSERAATFPCWVVGGGDCVKEEGYSGRGGGPLRPPPGGPDMPILDCVYDILYRNAAPRRAVEAITGSFT